MSNVLLNVQNLTVYSATKPIVKNLSFNLNKGQMLALIGQSGSGKTLLMSSFLGLNHAVQSTGIIRLNNITLPISSNQAKDWQDIRGKKIGYIFQDPKQTLNPLHTIKQAFLLAFKRVKLPKKERLQQIQSLLQTVGLTVPLNRYPHQLSGGEAQRLAIALVLALNPQVIIADEPTSSLDDHHSQQVLALFKKIADEGRAVIVISHQIEGLQAFDKILWLSQDGFKLDNYQQIQRYLPKLDFGLPKPILDDQEVILQINQLTLAYKKPWQGKSPVIIKDFNLVLKNGQVSGLAGISGAGKSSIAKAITCLDNQLWVRGEIILTCQETKVSLLDLKEKEKALYRSKIIWVMQDMMDSLNPNLQIRHSIAESFIHQEGNQYYQTEHYQKISQLCQLLGLSEALLWRYPDELSGGEKTRVVLLRALLANPMILILDEPTSMLDDKTAFQVIHLLKMINQRLNIAMLIISHDKKILQSMCQQIIYIK